MLINIKVVSFPKMLSDSKIEGLLSSLMAADVRYFQEYSAILPVDSFPR